MYTLGINAYHGDSSACIYRHNELIVATEEERFRRIKHWAGLPTEAIEFCLREAGIGLEEVDVITVSRDPLAKIDEKIIRSIKNLMSLSAIKDRAMNSIKIRGIKGDIAKAFGKDPGQLKAEVKFIEHHRSHMACAFFASDFEESAILSVDGMGDFTSTMRGTGKGNKINVMDSVSYPHSIGIFYTTFTQLLGFPHYGDEYKVMGLSPYGQRNMMDKLRDVLILKDNGLFELNSKYFRHFKEGIQMGWEDSSPWVGPNYTDAMIEAFGPVRQKEEKLTQYHMDLAASVQGLCEEAIFHMAEDLYKKTGLKNICVSGGVAQNSVANGKLIQNTSFDRLYVPSAGHDAGTSIGSALYYLHHDKGLPRNPALNAYTGVSFSNEAIEEYLQGRNIPYQRHSDDALFDVVSDCLVNGGVVGWYQGRAEFGPRALGNRSILADPRRPDAKELLNLKIKKRESFRPFAPSILKDWTGDYFEQVDEVPFMEKVFKIKENRRAEIPAVTHVDGTGRLQTVDRENAPRYYRLIDTFRQKTNVPILLNTSFNENEPIVNSPEHALECYLRTSMDMLVLENIVIRRD